MSVFSSFVNFYFYQNDKTKLTICRNKQFVIINLELVNGQDMTIYGCTVSNK